MKWWQDMLKDKETQKLNLNLTCTFKTSEAGWPYFINIFFVLLLLLVVYQIKNTSKLLKVINIFATIFLPLPVFW